LANILSHIINTLTAHQTSSSNSNQRRTKAYISDIFSSIKLDKLIIFYFNIVFISMQILYNSIMTLLKLTSQ